MTTSIIEIFKAGTHIDANGQTVGITESDLKATAQAYKANFHEAPIVIGHPQSNTPAYGWVKGLKVENGSLMAEVEASSELKELFKNGHFKKVSASFYKPNNGINPEHKGFYLRHVGVLGAMPPAIKGMKDPIFNEKADYVDFLETSLNQGENPAMNNKDTKDNLNNASSSESNAKLAELEHKFSELEKSHKDLESTNATLKADNQRLQGIIEANNKAQAEKANADFAEGLITAGKLAPAQKEQVLALLNTDHRTADFSENDFKRRLKEFLSNLHPVLDFSETATKVTANTAEDHSLSYAQGTNPASIEMDKKVEAYAKEHNLSYVDAFNALNR